MTDLSSTSAEAMREEWRIVPADLAGWAMRAEKCAAALEAAEKERDDAYRRGWNAAMTQGQQP